MLTLRSTMKPFIRVIDIIHISLFCTKTKPCFLQICNNLTKFNNNNNINCFVFVFLSIYRTISTSWRFVQKRVFQCSSSNVTSVEHLWYLSALYGDFRILRRFVDFVIAAGAGSANDVIGTRKLWYRQGSYVTGTLPQGRYVLV